MARLAKLGDEKCTKPRWLLTSTHSAETGLRLAGFIPDLLVNQSCPAILLLSKINICLVCDYENSWVGPQNPLDVPHANGMRTGWIVGCLMRLVFDDRTRWNLSYSYLWSKSHPTVALWVVLVLWNGQNARWKGIQTANPTPHQAVTSKRSENPSEHWGKKRTKKNETKYPLVI